MVTMREKHQLVRYCSIGTGNLNEDTAKHYTDCSLLTANQEICSEVSNLFDFLNETSTTAEISITCLYRRSTPEHA